MSTHTGAPRRFRLLLLQILSRCYPPLVITIPDLIPVTIQFPPQATSIILLDGGVLSVVTFATLAQSLGFCVEPVIVVDSAIIHVILP
jgi:hypothetical protein